MLYIPVEYIILTAALQGDEMEVFGFLLFVLLQGLVQGSKCMII